MSMRSASESNCISCVFIALYYTFHLPNRLVEVFLAEFEFQFEPANLFGGVAVFVYLFDLA